MLEFWYGAQKGCITYISDTPLKARLRSGFFYIYRQLVDNARFILFLSIFDACMFSDIMKSDLLNIVDE